MEDLVVLDDYGDELVFQDRSMHEQFRGALVAGECVLLDTERAREVRDWLTQWIEEQEKKEEE